jgi:4-hydroxy-tetrahydrodipicolinate synthase
MSSLYPRLFTALVTPFKGDSVDLECYQRQIHHQLEGGVTGLVVLGTTGEAPTVSSAERRALIRTAVATAPKACVMVATSSNSTATSVALSREAKELGAQMALVCTPYYNCPTQEGIFRHFEAIAEVGLPICVYNHPKRCGRNIELATLKRLAEIPQVVGIKEASGDISQMQQILNAFSGEDFPLWSGDDSLALPAMALGSYGLISVTSNAAPGLVAELVATMAEERLGDARQVHNQLQPLLKALFAETNPIGVKAAMEELGFPVGPGRLPLTPATADTRKALKAALEELIALKR